MEDRWDEEGIEQKRIERNIGEGWDEERGRGRGKERRVYKVGNDEEVKKLGEEGRRDGKRKNRRGTEEEDGKEKESIV